MAAPASPNLKDTPLMRAKPSDFALKPCSIGELRLEQGFCGERYDSGKSPLSRAPVAPAHDQTLAPAGFILIAWFGKLHYVSPALFKRDAAKYQELHWKDAWLLLDSIRSNKAIYDEWANPEGFFATMTAGTVMVVERARAWGKAVKDAPKPDPKDFDKLSDRAYDNISRLVKWELEADKVVRDGVELEQLREDLKRLLKNVDKFRQNAIESAEGTTEFLETVEGTSFQLLNIVPTLTMMDPFREAAYKIGVLLLRASARGVGGYTAWGTKEAAFSEAFGIIRREGTTLIVDLIMLPVGRLVGGIGTDAARAGFRHALTAIIQQLIEFICGYFKLLIENEGKQPTSEQLRHLLMDRAAALVGAIVGLLIPTKLGESARKTLIKGVVEAVLTTLITDFENAVKAAEKSDRTVTEVMFADLPGMLMRLVQASIVGVCQRRAQHAAQFAEKERYQRGEGGTNFTEAAKLLNDSEVGDTWRSGTLNKNALEGMRIDRNKNPVKVFSREEYNRNWARANGAEGSGLDFATAQTERRYADNMNVVVIAMDPAESRLRHTGTPDARGAKAPKPMPVKCKSSNHPDAPAEIAGLVVRPIKDPPHGPTHKNYEEAMATWREHVDHMFEAGYMVRKDGVVFHPDQLERWGQLHPELKEQCRRAIETLEELRAGGTHDLGAGTPNLPGGPAAAERVRAAMELLQSAKVGFYSDLDLVEIVDFGSGRRRFMGDNGEEEEVIDMSRDNREHLNRSLNIHDYDDPALPDDVRQLARRGDAAQHGGNAEIVTISKKTIEKYIVPLGKLHLVFPGGDTVFLNEATMRGRGYNYDGLDRETKTKRLDADIRVEIEKELKNRLGDKYKDFFNRAESVRKDYNKVTNKPKSKSREPTPITPLQLVEARKAVNGIEIMDVPGLGEPVPEIDIQNGFVRRLLSIDQWNVSQACSSTGVSDRRADLATACRKWNTVIGVDYDRQRGEVIGRNIVIAVAHYDKTVGEAIEGLIRTRMALQLVPSHIHLWYELYTAYRPVSVDYVRDRLGDANPGVRGRGKDLADSASCFAPGKNQQLYAFATTGFVETYTPKPPKQERDPDVPPGHKKIYMQGGFAIVPDDDPAQDGQRSSVTQDPRPIRGLLLTNVWEDTVKKTIDDYKPTNLSGDCRVAVFPASLLARIVVDETKLLSSTAKR